MRVAVRTSNRLTLTEWPWPFWLMGLLLIAIVVGLAPCVLRQSESPMSCGSDLACVVGIVFLHVLIAALGVAMLVMPQTQWDFDVAGGTATRRRRWFYFITRTKVWSLDSLAGAKLAFPDNSSDSGPAYCVDLVTRDGQHIPLGTVASAKMSTARNVVEALSDVLKPP